MNYREYQLLKHELNQFILKMAWDNKIENRIINKMLVEILQGYIVRYDENRKLEESESE